MAERIRSKIEPDRLYFRTSDQQWFSEPGVYFPNGDFSITGFVDATFFGTAKPMQVPEGDYIGALRKPGADFAQRSIYGYKGHGVHLLSLCLPMVSLLLITALSAHVVTINACWIGATLMKYLRSFSD
jgi:hypothetical protein